MEESKKPVIEIYGESHLDSRYIKQIIEREKANNNLHNVHFLVEGDVSNSVNDPENYELIYDGPRKAFLSNVPINPQNDWDICTQASLHYMFKELEKCRKKYSSAVINITSTPQHDAIKGMLKSNKYSIANKNIFMTHAILDHINKNKENKNAKYIIIVGDNHAKSIKIAMNNLGFNSIYYRTRDNLLFNKEYRKFIIDIMKEIGRKDAEEILKSQLIIPVVSFFPSDTLNDDFPPKPTNAKYQNSYLVNKKVYDAYPKDSDRERNLSEQTRCATPDCLQEWNDDKQREHFQKKYNSYNKYRYIESKNELQKQRPSRQSICSIM